MATGKFLAGVGALIWDGTRERYLIARRSESKDFAAGAWECITGRLEQGEGFESALHREVMEEAGITIRPIYIVGTTHFHRGKERAENELVGIVYLCETEGRSEIKLSAEHSEYRWLNAEEIATLLSKSDHPAEQWLRQVVERAEIAKRVLTQDRIHSLSLGGFELDN